MSITPTSTSLESERIALFLSPNLPLTADRVSISAGTEPVTVHHISRFPDYAGDAIVPRPPWLPSNITRFSQETAFEKHNHAKAITIIRVAQSVLAPLENGSLLYLKDFDACKSAFATLAAAELMREFAVSLAVAYSSQFNRVRALGLQASSQTGCLTSTVDGNTRKRLGLHVDNWDECALLEKEGARNRICVNLGAEDRSFLFVDVTIKGMIAALELKMAEIASMGHHGLSRMFMRTFPDYGVTRVSIGPGEAYIAPTDNVIHDASTEGKAYPDTVFTLLGDFCAHQSRFGDPALRASLGNS